MNRLCCFLVVALAPTLARSQAPAPLVDGLKHPESVAVGGDGRVYVTSMGESPGKRDGAVVVLDKGKAVPFATGLDEPKGIAAYQKLLFVADKQGVWRIDLKGKAELYAPAKAFPSPPQILYDVVADPESGTVYVSDCGDLKGKGGAIYRIHPKGKIDLISDATRWPAMHTPNGLVLDGASHLLVADFGTGAVTRLRIADGKPMEQLATGLGKLDGLAWDEYGRLFITDRELGRVFAIPRPGAQPVLMAKGFQHAGDLCYDPIRRHLLVPDIKAGTLNAVAVAIPGAEVDESPLPLETTVAFPELQWTGWKGEDKGKIVMQRPILLTHAGDGRNRVFLATQQGVIHVFPNKSKAKQTKLFLDIQDRVSYADNQNEEGFLGLAFHPRYKENGEFFVFYTPKKEKMTNIVSRFRVSKDDPDRADPASEDILLRFKKPFWNHDGGTICFGPDGYLYVTHGDGGAANDPFNNGQNLKTMLGKILRIDVDRKDDGKAYAIPKDNPFVTQADALPEIWAYGLRNVWRMAFDRKTGQLWAGEVGQNLYEEINLIVKGGNYGWKLREGLHPFGTSGVGPRADLIDPIWEYHHDIGKSITGGVVYRGRDLPELNGMYLYADYVSGRVWALRYDETARRVTANRTIRERGPPLMSFGEDEQGEVYCMTYTANGRGLFRFTRPTR